MDFLRPSGDRIWEEKTKQGCITYNNQKNKIEAGEKPTICLWCSRQNFQFLINLKTAKSLGLAVPLGY